MRLPAVVSTPPHVPPLSKDCPIYRPRVLPFPSPTSHASAACPRSPSPRQLGSPNGRLFLPTGEGSIFCPHILFHSLRTSLETSSPPPSPSWALDHRATLGADGRQALDGKRMKRDGAGQKDVSHGRKATSPTPPASSSHVPPPPRPPSLLLHTPTCATPTRAHLPPPKRSTKSMLTSHSVHGSSPSTASRSTRSPPGRTCASVCSGAPRPRTRTITA